MSRRDRHAANRRRILSVAAKLVARHGPEGLSLREVARGSGYSPASLYAYFDGRDAILDALAGRYVEALLAVLGTPAEDEHPLVGLALAWLAFSQQHPARLALALRQPDDRIAAVFVERVEACVATGEIITGPGFDVDEIAATVQATAHGFATLGHPPELLREAMRCLLEGLR